MPVIPPAAHDDRLHLLLLLALTFSTGVIDAVGFLGLDRVFTGNMTGNVVILGMGLAGADHLPIVGPTIALCGFVVGAAIGGRVLWRIPAGWTPRSTALFAVVGGTLVGIAVVLACGNSQKIGVTQYVATGALGMAMGTQAATARHIAVREVTTVVITSTLTGLAAHSLLSDSDKLLWRRRASAVALIGLGAVTGAITLLVHIALGLVLAGAITLAVAWVGHAARNRTNRPVSNSVRDR